LLPKQDVEALHRAAASVTHDVIRHTWSDKFDVRVKLPLGFEESLVGAVPRLVVGLSGPKASDVDGPIGWQD